MPTIKNEDVNALIRITKAVAVILVVMAAAAAAIAYVVTRSGVGFEADSMAYVTAARTLTEQGRLLTPDLNGNLVPFNHWPPLYPALLAALRPVAGDALVAARDLNIVLFPLNLLLLALLVWRTTRSAATTLVLSAIFLLSPNLLDIHITAMSEAPSLTCWLAGLIFLVEYRRNGAWGWLVGATLAAAVCVMVRYVGVVLIITGAGFILAYTKGSWVRRGVSALLYLTVAMVPLAGWLLSRPGSGVNTERHWGFYGLGSEQISAAAVAMLRWLAPIDKYGALKLGLAALLIIGMVILTVSLVRTTRSPPRKKRRSRCPIARWRGCSPRISSPTNCCCLSAGCFLIRGRISASGCKHFLSCSCCCWRE